MLCLIEELSERLTRLSPKDTTQKEEQASNAETS